MEHEGMRPHLWMRASHEKPQKQVKSQKRVKPQKQVKPQTTPQKQSQPQKTPLKEVKPLAKYVLTKNKFNTFCNRLENLKVPSGYSSDIGKHVRERKFGALKSHDYHVIMQTLMPLALRGLMEKTTRLAIMRCSRLFRRLCYQVWDPVMADTLRVDVAETLCLLQMTFPPSFFVIMSHLPVHLVEELIILGSVHIRWMYPIERAIEALKSHVKNKARPEASIARGYLQEETLRFMTTYLEDYGAVRRRIWDADAEDGEEYEVVEGRTSENEMSKELRNQAHMCVLQNNTLMAPLYALWEAEFERTGGGCGDVEMR